MADYNLYWKQLLVNVNADISPEQKTGGHTFPVPYNRWWPVTKICLTEYILCTPVIAKMAIVHRHSSRILTREWAVIVITRFQSDYERMFQNNLSLRWQGAMLSSGESVAHDLTEFLARVTIKQLPRKSNPMGIFWPNCPLVFCNVYFEQLRSPIVRQVWKYL